MSKRCTTSDRVLHCTNYSLLGHGKVMEFDRSWKMSWNLVGHGKKVMEMPVSVINTHQMIKRGDVM